MLVVGTLFKPSLMLAGEARGLPKSGALERCFTRLGSGLTRKHFTRLERLVRDKHSSFFGTFIIYD